MFTIVEWYIRKFGRVVILLVNFGDNGPFKRLQMRLVILDIGSKEEYLLSISNRHAFDEFLVLMNNHFIVRKFL